MSFDENTFQELATYAFLRLDGAWFRFVAARLGMEEAADIDAEVWQDLSMRLVWKIKKLLNIGPADHAATLKSLPLIGELAGRVMGFRFKSEMRENTLISQISHCQYWEGIKKAGFAEYAEAGVLCSKVHHAGYLGMLQGAFSGLEFELSQTKSIPQGDLCCEVIISLPLELRKYLT